MGKGFNNFMSKKDFHPSAIWNLKRVWEARQKKTLDQKKQEEMRSQYEKEQEILNNKALLGDEKAKLGLSFMYDAPAGMSRQAQKEEEEEIEPKFEWQRKYNAPREEWAKGNEDIMDQPFGIQVRNVRCMKCHKYGHINTDRECPLFAMSGSKDEPGFSTNPSDLMKHNRKRRMPSEHVRKVDCNEEEEDDDKHDPRQLVSNMNEEYGLTLRNNVMQNINVDTALKNMGPTKVKTEAKEVKTEHNEANQNQIMLQYMATMTEKDRTKILRKLFKNKSGKSETKKKKKSKKSKKAKKEKNTKRHDSSSESEEDTRNNLATSSRPIVKQEPESPPHAYSNAYKDQKPIKKEQYWQSSTRHQNGRDDYKANHNRQERNMSPLPRAYKRHSPRHKPYVRRSPSPRQNVRRSPSPRQNVRRSPSPRQNVRRSPSPRQNVRRSPSPRHNVRRSPSPRRHTIEASNKHQRSPPPRRDLNQASTSASKLSPSPIRRRRSRSPRRHSPDTKKTSSTRVNKEERRDRKRLESSSEDELNKTSKPARRSSNNKTPPLKKPRRS